MYMNHDLQDNVCVSEMEEDAPLNPLLQLPTHYFQQLQQKAPGDPSTDTFANNKALIEAADGCVFDRESVEQALVLCQQLRAYLGQLSDNEAKALQLIHPFYKTSERLLNKLQLCFMGDWTVKEKIIRIYTTKAFGVYKMIQNIISCSELFESMPPEMVKNSKFALWKYTESIFTQVKGILPAEVQANLQWTPKTLVPNVIKFFIQGTPLFDENSDYQKITENFRAFLFNIFASPYLNLYLERKGRLLKHWLYEELFLQDVQYLEEHQQAPQFTPIKLQIYQNLKPLFLNLEPEDQWFDQMQLLKESDLSVLNREDAFLSTSTDGTLCGDLDKARQTEKALLDTLSVNQLSSVAEWVHKKILELKDSQSSECRVPSLNVRNTDIACEQKAEQAYTSNTIDILMKYSEKLGSSKGKFLKTLKQMKNKFLGEWRKKETLKESPMRNGEIPQRVLKSQPLLESAPVDWVGFGRAFKETVYEKNIPHWQQSFFEHRELKGDLWRDYKIGIKVLMAFYEKQGYLQKKTFKVGATEKGRYLIKKFEDCAIYLKTSENTILGLGRAPFCQSSEPFYYFQLFRTEVSKPYHGSNKKIDYSRNVDGVKYELESFEKIQSLRPILFLNLILALDSLPDEIRNQHADLLKGLYQMIHESRRSN